MMDRQESIHQVLLLTIPELAGKIFINDLPAMVEAGVLLKEGYSGANIDPEIKGLRKTRFQIAVRDSRENQVLSKRLCKKIMDALSMEVETRVPDGILIKHCRPLTEPIPYPISNGNNIEYSLNFFITYVV